MEQIPRFPVGARRTNPNTTRPGKPRYSPPCEYEVTSKRQPNQLTRTCPVHHLRVFRPWCYPLATFSFTFSAALPVFSAPIPISSSLRYSVDRPILRRRATSDICPR